MQTHKQKHTHKSTQNTNKQRITYTLRHAENIQQAQMAQHTYTQTKKTQKTQTNNVTQQVTENKFTDADTIHATAMPQFVFDLCSS